MSRAPLLLVVACLSACQMLLPRKGDNLPGDMEPENREICLRIRAARQRAARGGEDGASALEFARALRVVRDRHLYGLVLDEKEWSWPTIHGEMVAAVDQ